MEGPDGYGKVVIQARTASHNRSRCEMAGCIYSHDLSMGRVQRIACNQDRAAMAISRGRIICVATDPQRRESNKLHKNCHG